MQSPIHRSSCLRRQLSWSRGDGLLSGRGAVKSSRGEGADSQMIEVETATSNVPFFILAWRKTITPRPAGSLSYPATIPAMNHVPKSCTPRSAQKLPQLPGNCNGHGAGQLKYIIKKLTHNASVAACLHSTGRIWYQFLKNQKVHLQSPSAAKRERERLGGSPQIYTNFLSNHGTKYQFAHD